MANTQLVLSQFKNFWTSWIEYWIRYLYAKIISERCELVKLCHIDRSGPVFLRHSVDIRVRLLSLIVWIYLHLFHTLMWGLENSARRCVTVVLGHSRSSKLVPTESPCACDFLFGCWVDRLETLAFDCFIQEQTEEFSVSCCMFTPGTLCELWNAPSVW